MRSFDKLEKELSPLIKEAIPLHSFGFSSAWPSYVIDEITLKQDRLYKLIERMISIIKKHTGIYVYRFPGTYRDFYFCRCDDPTKIVIAIDENGIIEDDREYA